MSSKYILKSLDKKFLPGILALIFLLTMSLPDITLSEENQDGKQNILRQASLKWMEVGIQQYQKELFTDAERSFRRANVFRNFLTDAEREQLDEYLTNASIGKSEGKQAIIDKQAAEKTVDPNQPVKPEVKVEKVVEKAKEQVKESHPSTEEGQVPAREGRKLIDEGPERIEGAAKAQAQLQAQTKAYSALEEQLKAETQARLMAQQEAKAQTQARTIAEEKADTEAKARIEAQKRADQEAKLRAGLEEQLKAEIEARTKIEADAKEAVAAAKADAEAKKETYAATIKQTEQMLKVQTEQAAKAQAELQAQAQAYSALEEQLKAETQARLKAQQEAQAVTAAEQEVPENQAEAESSQDIIVIKDKSLKARLLRLSEWLSQNQRNILIIALPLLAVLVIISRLNARRKRPGKRVYNNQVPANSSFIGAKLNGNNKNNRRVKGSKKTDSASAAAANPKPKSFEQSSEFWMEHWRERHNNKVNGNGQPSRINGKWPERKDKSTAGDRAITKAELKQCRKCRERKSRSDFHKDKSCKDGLARWCKECKKQYRKERTVGKK